MSEYERGFREGWSASLKAQGQHKYSLPRTFEEIPKRKAKRKPSAYNNFVAQKAKLPRFKYKSSRGKKKKGMTNMKAIGVAWRKLSKNQQAKFK